MALVVVTAALVVGVLLRQQMYATVAHNPSAVDSTRDLLGLDIARSWNDVRVAWQAVQVLEKAIAQAELNVREVAGRFAHGMVSFADAPEAQVPGQQTHERGIAVAVEQWLAHRAYLRSLAAERTVATATSDGR